MILESNLIHLQKVQADPLCYDLWTFRNHLLLENNLTKAWNRIKIIIAVVRHMQF
jgi:hypothetical protein